MADGHWVWEGERGRVEVRRLGPKFVTVELLGRVDDGAVPMIDEVLTELAPVPEVEMFWDASRFDSFANAFRAKCVDHLMTHRKTIANISVISSSALISMAISTTNLVMGGMIKAYRDPAKFQDAQREAATRQGLDLGQLAV
jgi:hypothetical protein